MRRTVIAVTTANRPEILNRCLTAAVADRGVARDARWIVLHDLAPKHCIGTREIVRSWIKRGLEITYIDKAAEDEISNSLPLSSFRNYFRHLTDRPSTHRVPVSRNLALLTGLSLEPELLLFMDDDIVHHHGEACFFEWCANNIRVCYIATPRKRGISDMSYSNRLLRILERDVWREFVSPRGLSADPELWFSPANPLWKLNVSGEEQESRAAAESEIVANSSEVGCEHWIYGYQRSGRSVASVSARPQRRPPLELSSIRHSRHASPISAWSICSAFAARHRPSLR